MFFFVPPWWERTMGGEIAQVIASDGILVVLKDIKQEFVDTGPKKAQAGDRGRSSAPW